MNPKTFTKMHGLGNDFIVLNCLDTPFDWQKSDIQAMSNRHFGIGFDQLLIVEKSPNEAYDFTYRIFNADGNEVEHCGNGARCFAKYLKEQKLFDFSRPVRAKIKRGAIEISYCGKKGQEELFEVAVAIPNFNFFSQAQESALFQEIPPYPAPFAILSLGNPHAVCEVKTHDEKEIQNIGKALQNHPLFPEKVNVGFMQILNPQHIKLRVFERGVGETLACGTGACAAAVAGIARGVLKSPVQVELLGGTLEIKWQGEGETVYMTGSASQIYQGTIL